MCASCTVQPDRPAVNRFYLSALISTLDGPSGSDWCGQKIAMEHLARHIFLYTGAAVPAPLRPKLFDGAATLVTDLHDSLMGQSAADRAASKECNAPSALLVWAHRDTLMRAACRSNVAQALAETLAQDAECCSAHAKSLDECVFAPHADGIVGAPTAPHLAAPEGAPVLVTRGVRGSGLASTAFGYLAAPQATTKLLRAWARPQWWRTSQTTDVLLFIDMCPFDKSRMRDWGTVTTETRALPSLSSMRLFRAGASATGSHLAGVLSHMPGLRDARVAFGRQSSRRTACACTACRLRGVVGGRGHTRGVQSARAAGRADGRSAARRWRGGAYMSGSWRASGHAWLITLAMVCWDLTLCANLAGASMMASLMLMD
jgi:hypothetical protein